MRMALTMGKGAYRMAVAALFLLCPASLLSQGPPITTDTAFVNGLEGAAVRSFVFNVNRSGLLSDGTSVTDPLDREVSIIGVPIVFPYEVMKNRFVLAGVFPILYKSMELTQNGERRTISTTGIGDFSLGAKYLLVQRDVPGKTTRVAALGKIKFPSGKNNETDDQGNPLPRTLQLGSGSVDYSLGSVFTHVARRVGFNTELLYNFRTEADGFAFGDSFRYNLSFGYRLLPVVYKVYPARNHLNAYLELNGEYFRRDQANGTTIADSGGNVIYLSPGIQVIPGNFILEASLSLPVSQSLNGMQLKFRPGFRVGFRWLLF